MKTYWKFEVLVSIHGKMAALSNFASNCQKLILFGKYFSTSQIPAICFSWMCIRHAKNNGAVANLSQANIDFTINYPLNMLFCHFRYFHFFNIDMSFDKMTNFPSFPMLQIFMIWKPFTCICKKASFIVYYFEIQEILNISFLWFLEFALMATDQFQIEVTYIIKFQKIGR